MAAAPTLEIAAPPEFAADAEERERIADEGEREPTADDEGEGANRKRDRSMPPSATRDSGRPMRSSTTKCCVCKEPAFAGDSCTECGQRVHSRCSNWGVCKGCRNF